MIELTLFHRVVTPVFWQISGLATHKPAYQVTLID